MTKAMTEQEKKIKSARGKALTEAKRSLGLIADAVAADQATLVNGGVPDRSNLQPSVTKYGQAIDRLNLLDSLGDGTPVPEEDGQITDQHRADIRKLIGAMRATGLIPEAVEPGSAIDRLTQTGWPGERAEDHRSVQVAGADVSVQKPLPFGEPER